MEEDLVHLIAYSLRKDKDMKPEYKKTTQLAPFCPKCKKKLKGDNSIAFPWNCECGEWKANRYPFTGEYEIIKKMKIKK